MEGARVLTMSVAHAQMTMCRNSARKGFAMPIPEMPARKIQRPTVKGIPQKPRENRISQTPLHHWQAFQIHMPGVFPSGLKRPTMAKTKKNRLGYRNQCENEERPSLDMMNPKAVPPHATIRANGMKFSCRWEVTGEIFHIRGFESILKKVSGETLTFIQSFPNA